MKHDYGKKCTAMNSSPDPLTLIQNKWTLLMARITTTSDTKQCMLFLNSDQFVINCWFQTLLNVMHYSFKYHPKFWKQKSCKCLCIKPSYNFFIMFFSLKKTWYCTSLVNPDSTVLMPKEGFHWSRLLVNIAQKQIYNRCTPKYITSVGR